VLGPIVFAALLVLVVRFFRRALPDDDRILLAFALPPFVVVIVNAIISGRANANWAAPGAVAAFIVASAWLVRSGRHRLLVAGIAFGLVAQVVLLLADPFADRLTLPLRKNGDVYQRTMGWSALGKQVAAIAHGANAAAVAADNRSEAAVLRYYYLRREGLPVFIWTGNRSPTNQFELTRSLRTDGPQPVLMLSSCESAKRYRAAFQSIVILPGFEAASGPRSSRKYSAFVLSGGRADIAPLPPCA
jgi:hypothetical protein